MEWLLMFIFRIFEYALRFKGKTLSREMNKRNNDSGRRASLDKRTEKRYLIILFMNDHIETFFPVEFDQVNGN